MNERIAALRSQILKAKQAYYYGDNALMTDAAYDALEEELAALSPNDDVLAIVGAPCPPDSLLAKAEHRIHMGSQSKVNSVAEFATWFEKSVPAEGEILAALKADGASAAAYYRYGRLEQAISRGDGVIGEDITANAVKFKGLPVYVSCPVHGPFTGAARFEVVLTVADWQRIEPTMSKNPRNLGSGIMGRKDGSQSEFLTAFVFDLSEERDGADFDFGTEFAKIDRIAALGFDVMPHRRCDTLDQASAYFTEIDTSRSTLPFWIDGVVMKINDLAHQTALGMVNQRPKGQIAWKFESVGAETVLRSFSISGGHTGALVPNAQFEPVEIGGTTVSNALLANWEEIARLDVAVGDTVYVIKANDIIPKIIEVRDRPLLREPIPEPTSCPFCETPTHRRVNTTGDEGAVTICPSPDCPVKATGKIKRWVKSLDILGIGGSVLESLVDQLGVENAAGLYTLRDRRDTLAAMQINTERGIRLGESRADSIIEAIEAKRDLTLVDFLGSLGLEKLGKVRAAKMIAGAAPHLHTLSAWREGLLRNPLVAESAGAPKLGDVIQDAIDGAAELIDGLLANGVTVADIAEDAEVSESAATANGTVCITGKLPSGKKKNDYKELLQAAGFELVDKVTKELTYLVLADPSSSSSKAQKARKLGVSLLSEEQLEALL